MGPWRAPTSNLLPKAGEVGSPSQLRRRLRRAAERSAVAAAKAAEEAATRAAAEEAATKAAAGETAAKAAADEVTARAIAEQVAAKAESKEVAAKDAAEKVAAKAFSEEVIAKPVAEEAAAKAAAESVVITAAAEKVGAKGGAAYEESPSREILESDQATTSGKNSQPLPVCHYCCHKGSGKYPVHYYPQCMCDDSPCTCLCYCSGAQLEHKHRVFPRKFWGKTCDSVDVPKAKALADKRTQRLRGYSPNCTSENCVRYMKEDGLYLT